MFRAGAIPLGVGLRICMEGWGAICARICSGALGRASLKEKHHKSVISANHNLVPRDFSLAVPWLPRPKAREKSLGTRLCQSPSHATIGGCGDYVTNTRFCKLMLTTPQWENQKKVWNDLCS